MTKGFLPSTKIRRDRASLRVWQEELISTVSLRGVACCATSCHLMCEIAQRHIPPWLESVLVCPLMISKANQAAIHLCCCLVPMFCHFLRWMISMDYAPFVWLGRGQGVIAACVVDLWYANTQSRTGLSCGISQFRFQLQKGHKSIIFSIYWDYVPI